MRKRGFLCLGLIGALALGASGCIKLEEQSVQQTAPAAQGASDPAGVPEEEAPMAPDFSLPNDAGEMVTLSDYRGQIVVLNIWASWCPPCKGEMPEFQQMHESWQAQRQADPQADVPVLLAIDVANGYRGETREVAQTFIRENGYTFTILYDESENGDVAFQYSSGSIPMTYVIDREGRVHDVFYGQTTRARVEESIARLEEA